MARTFLLGVGGQKCGTTWLHDYLSKSQQSKFGLLKEYHLFDSLHIPECEHFYAKRMVDAREALAQPGYRFDTDPALWKRVTFLSDPEEYYDYFAGLLSRPKVVLTGDITPSYCGLPVEVFKTIRRRIRARGMRIRVIFLMRDPLERCWSAVRMERRERLLNDPDTVFTTTEAEDLVASASNANFTLRTRYDLTMAALEEAFEPSELYYGFYETLFDRNEIARICDFLGINMHEPDLGLRKNASPKNEHLERDAETAVVDIYRETYLEIAHRFGAERMRQIWGGFDLLDCGTLWRGKSVPLDRRYSAAS